MDLDEIIRQHKRNRIETEDPLRAEYFAGLVEGLEFCRDNVVIGRNKPKRSAYISEFLKFITQQQHDYTYSCEQLDRHEKVKQDLLHELELDSQTDEEFLDVAKRLQENRRQRRGDKDEVEESVKIVDTVNLPEMTKCFNRLRLLLGEVRKVEQYHENRVYRKKNVDGRS